jgi:hypothetical protein
MVKVLWEEQHIQNTVADPRDCRGGVEDMFLRVVVDTHTCYAKDRGWTDMSLLDGFGM